MKTRQVNNRKLTNGRLNFIMTRKNICKFVAVPRYGSIAYIEKPTLRITEEVDSSKMHLNEVQKFSRKGIHSATYTTNTLKRGRIRAYVKREDNALASVIQKIEKLGYTEADFNILPKFETKKYLISK